MQIVTIEDQAFQALLQALKKSKRVGSYWRKGKAQIVCATNQFMLVSCELSPDKIAIKPARTLGEAENLGLQLLFRENQRGNQVKLEEEYL